MSKWYKWSSLDAFNSWHSYVKDQLGIPCPNYNLATGEVQAMTAYWTLEYTDPVILSENDVRAVVEDDALGFTEGLGEVSEAPDVLLNIEGFEL